MFSWSISKISRPNLYGKRDGIKWDMFRKKISFESQPISLPIKYGKIRSDENKSSTQGKSKVQSPDKEVQSIERSNKGYKRNLDIQGSASILTLSFSLYYSIQAKYCCYCDKKLSDNLPQFHIPRCRYILFL